jgi:hypothetical protein
MHRRSLLSWLGASAVSSLNLPRVAEAQSPKGIHIVSLESFRVADADQMPRLHAYLGGTLLPFVRQIQNGPAICLEAIVAPHTPQALLVSVFSDFDEMLDVRNRTAAHSGIRQARTELESQHVLYQVQSQVLTAAPRTLRFPAHSDRLAAGIFEIRSYQAPGWHDEPPTRLSEVLNRAGIEPIVSASTAASEHLPQFTYLIPFRSLVEREKAWTRFEADPEWIDMQQESAARHGSVVQVTAKSIYKPAPYSRWA